MLCLLHVAHFVRVSVASGTDLWIRVECVLVWSDVWDVVGIRFYIALGFSPGCRLFCSLGKGGVQGCNVDFLSFFSHFLWVYGGRVGGMHTLTND